MARAILLIVYVSTWVILAKGQNLPVSDYLLYTGKAYVQYPPAEGTASYKNRNFDTDARITYHGQTYEGTTLMYDLVLDEVVILHPEKSLPVILSAKWIDDFVINQDTFVNVLARDWPGLPEDGFYHRYYSSQDILCLASYSKELRDERHDSRRTRHFRESTRYFVRFNQSEPFKEISTHRQLLNLDPANRRENRRHLFSLGLHSRDKLGEAILVFLATMSQADGD